MKKFLLLFGGVLLFSPLVFAVSYVGGGRCQSVISDCTIEIPLPPAQYSSVQQDMPEALRLVGFPQFGKAGIYVSNVRIHEFASLYENWIHSPWADIQAYYEGMGWTVRANNNPCVLVMTKSNETSYFGFATWGQGKGIVLIATKEKEAINVINKAFDKIELGAGACSW